METINENKLVPNPEENTNIISKLFCLWTWRIFSKGYRKKLTLTDLYKPLKEHKSNFLGDLLSCMWEFENCDALKFKRKPHLRTAIFKAFAYDITFIGIMEAIFRIGIRPLYPIFLGKLLSYFNPESNTGKHEAYFYATGVILCSLLFTLFSHPSAIALQHIGMKIRIACSSLIYRKALRLNRISLTKTSTGQMINLLSNDVNRFDLWIITINTLWTAPFTIFICTYIMYWQIGISAVIGISVLISFFPLQGYLGQRTSIYRYYTARFTDERVRIMNEIINGIQVIKMYTWEKLFCESATSARTKEMNQVRKNGFVRGTNSAFSMFNSRIALFATLVSYVLFGNVISAEKVFTVTSCINIICNVIAACRSAITQIIEGFISLNRIEHFLMLEEIDIMHSNLLKCDSNYSVIMRNITAKWIPEAINNSLSDINVKITSKSLTMIVGPVGSGKSSLLKVILQELPILDGSLDVTGKISYASQEPWLFQASIRQNILFGLPFNKCRYNEVIKSCALEADLNKLPNGDKAIVGERGISLSGGQRARINLARAVYRSADIYLLDDPLSAVDSQVGRQIFDNCINGLLKDKIRILVTHQLQYLNNANQIWIVTNGNVVVKESFESLKNFHSDFIQTLQEQNNCKPDHFSLSDSDDKQKESVDNLKAKHIELDNDTDSVSSEIYKAYFNHSGYYLIVFSFLFSQISIGGIDYFVSYWVSLEEKITETKLEEKIDFSALQICNYTILIIATVGFMLSRSYIFYLSCMKSSLKLHNNLLKAIINAPMQFFCENSSGYILNLFSKDLGTIDEALPDSIMDCLKKDIKGLFHTLMPSTSPKDKEQGTMTKRLALLLSLTCLNIIKWTRGTNLNTPYRLQNGVILIVVNSCIICVITNVWFLIPTLVMGGFFYLLLHIYLATSRNIKRLEASSRSPVFSHLNASVHGLTTVRAFGAEQLLIKEFDNHQDLHSGAWYIYITTARLFTFLLDLACVSYLFVVTLSFVFFDLGISDSLAGLAITQTESLISTLQWGVRQITEVENQMTSVERVVRYVKIPSEKNIITERVNLNFNSSWPNQGKLEFKNVNLKYSSDGCYILKNIDFEIKPQEKIGIVGQTGAGKSSLISSLFRLSEIEGTILIDGVDTQGVSLSTIRSKISIIPQEPTLFTGSLRVNMDPFNEFSDNDLWNALESVKLKQCISGLITGLNTKITEGGQNFSVGQRQLICLARAILRNNRILVLDEATANIDPQTDALIQETIRDKFASCTVITIAHRLNTVMDSDRVIVMKDGQIVELNHPYCLLQNTNGLFYKMVQQSGNSLMENLFLMAKKSYNENFLKK